MLRKLLKYDFRSMWKQFAILWPAALALGLINRFTLPQAERADDALSSLLTMVPILVFTAVMIAMGVIALLYVIQRFYRGLLGDEGYLMHTLPVRPGQLIASKLICAVVMTVISGIVALAAIFLMVPGAWREIAEIFPAMGLFLREFGINGVLFLVEILLVSLLWIAQGFLHLYLAMALGHLASKHRVAMSALAYLGINVLGTIALNILSYANLPLNIRLDVLLGSPITATHVVLWVLILGSAAICALFFAVTARILGKNLNLE